MANNDNNDYYGDDMGLLDWLARALVIAGALNWGLMGLSGYINGDETEWNVVEMLTGTIPELEWLIYLLIGLAGLYELLRTVTRYSNRRRTDTETRTRT